MRIHLGWAIGAALAALLAVLFLTVAALAPAASHDQARGMALALLLGWASGALAPLLVLIGGVIAFANRAKPSRPT